MGENETEGFVPSITMVEFRRKARASQCKAQAQEYDDESIWYMRLEASEWRTLGYSVRCHWIAGPNLNTGFDPSHQDSGPSHHGFRSKPPWISVQVTMDSGASHYGFRSKSQWISVPITMDFGPSQL